MGGYGSGRYGYCIIKKTTDEFLALDIRKLGNALLNPGDEFICHWSCNGNAVSSINVDIEDDRVILKYTNKGLNSSFNDQTYHVLLSWSECNYGGRRPWFICPRLGCGKRVAILYAGMSFLCRYCNNLSYKSQRESLE